MRIETRFLFGLCVLRVFAVQPVLAEDAKPPAAWARHTIDDGSKGADGVRVADANGDGRADIATGWEQGGVVRVYLNPGPERARERWPAVTVGRVKDAEDAVFVDLDGDGAMDVVSSCEGRTRTMYVHWGPRDPAKYLDESAWQTQPIPATVGKQMWMYCLPMQVDGDGRVDLVVGSKGDNGAVGWLRSPENPRELEKWVYQRIVDAGWIMSLIRYDADHDGEPDILVSDRKGPTRGVYWLRRQTRPTDRLWTRYPIGGEDHEVMFLAVQNSLPGDRVYAATRNGVILAFTRGGTGPEFINGIRDPRVKPIPTWSAVKLANPFGSPGGKAVVVGTVDGAFPAIVHATETGGDRTRPGVAWIRNRLVPDGAIVPDRDERLDVPHDISGPQGAKFDRIELIDLDGDGDLDVLTTEEVDGLGVIWYENPAKRRPD